MFVALVGLLFSQSPSLDEVLRNARQANAEFASAWSAAEANDWIDAKLVAAVDAQAKSLPKPGDLRLAVARELIRRKRVDDAWERLKDLKPPEVSDRAALHFHRGGALQTLGRNDDAVKEFLALDDIADCPERYRAAAKAIRTQLAALQRDSLSGVAHDMREIRRRLEIGRPDERTQHLNKDVIARLDKLCEQCKKEADAAKKRSVAGKPSKPADESKPFQEKSTGENADGRRFTDFSKWGDLPEKERAKALQDLARDFPAHYRAAVEEYFKKLSKDGGEPHQ